MTICMERRKFIISSGSAVVLSLGSFGRPSMAVSLTIDNIESTKASNISSIRADFSTLEFIPEYVDSEKPVNISTELRLTDGSQNWNGSDSVDVRNYDNGVANDISNRISPVVDGISTTDSVIDGELVVEIDHPNLQTQTYRREFSISEASFLADPFIRVTESLESYEQDALDNTGSIGPDILETYVGPSGTVRTSSGGSITGIRRKENGDRVGTGTVRYSG